MQLKTMLFALALILGQTLAASVASAHDIDPAHTTDECAVCLTVQSIDTPPVPEAEPLYIVPLPAMAERSFKTLRAEIAPVFTKPPARAPPH